MFNDRYFRKWLLRFGWNDPIFEILLIPRSKVLLTKFLNGNDWFPK